MSGKELTEQEWNRCETIKEKKDTGREYSSDQWKHGIHRDWIERLRELRKAAHDWKKEQDERFRDAHDARVLQFLDWKRQKYWKEYFRRVIVKRGEALFATYTKVQLVSPDGWFYDGQLFGQTKDGRTVKIDNLKEVISQKCQEKTFRKR